MLRLFRGVSNGGWDPRENNFHLYTLVLAAQSLHAVGYAMGVQRDQARCRPDAGRREPMAAVMAYFGDGASSEGDVHESMVFAASNKSPVVFFCQNNHWAISVPTDVQSRIRCPTAPRATASPASAWTATTSSPSTPSRLGAGARPLGQGPGADRGLYLPDERAHHRGRSHQVPPVRRRGAWRRRIRWSGWKSICAPKTADDDFFDQSGRRRRARRRTPQTTDDLEAPDIRTASPTCTPSRTRWCRGAGLAPAVRGRLRRRSGTGRADRAQGSH